MGMGVCSRVQALLVQARQGMGVCSGRARPHGQRAWLGCMDRWMARPTTTNQRTASATSRRRETETRTLLARDVTLGIGGRVGDGGLAVVWRGVKLVGGRSVSIKVGRRFGLLRVDQFHVDFRPNHAFTISRRLRPKSRCTSRRLCRQLHIKSCKIARILAGTFLNLPDKAIRTLKVVASDKNSTTRRAELNF